MQGWADHLVLLDQLREHSGGERAIFVVWDCGKQWEVADLLLVLDEPHEQSVGKRRRDGLGRGRCSN